MTSMAGRQITDLEGFPWAEETALRWGLAYGLLRVANATRALEGLYVCRSIDIL